ncbi:LamG-like jellyroll fold domain-containing protein [Arsenicibacter rosenii]|uniref:LamG-like jellyroll fold domain-containing protein n=1 Tax=Arsenicibacter rosenii TaxID=1750698 RepID=UPI0015A6BF04|nr:LamG-like jellyroll fold domain-containing protein [Arsenicibacter rosenii]
MCLLLFFFSLLLTRALAQSTVRNAKTPGTGLRLSGAADNYLTLLNSEALEAGKTFTLEAWVKADDWKNTHFASTLFCTEDPETNHGFVVRAGGNRPNAYPTLALSTSEREIKVRGPQTMTAGRWYHIAAVVNHQQVSLYVDGQLAGQRTIASAYIPSGKQIRVGGAYYDNRGLTGLIDDVRIWNRSRTAAEILRDRGITLKGNEAGLVAWFPFDGTGSEVLKNKAKSAITAEYAGSGEPATGPGFTLATQDAGVGQIEGPDVFTARRGPGRIQVLVSNHGQTTLTQIPLAYAVNDQVVLRDTLTRTLAPGESFLHKTTVPVNCAPKAVSQLTVYTTLPGDGLAANDTARALYRATDSGKGRQTVVVFDSILHNYDRYGNPANTQYHTRQVVLPQDNARFSHIYMYVTLTCPAGGCGAEDAIGRISLVKHGKWNEIGRFITPYGVACGPWTIDVTDFKSELTGNCMLQSYIEAWWLKGWNLSVALEFIEGEANPLPYQKVTPLWQYDYFVYGDPTYCQQLTPFTYQASTKARQLTFRQTITGHGQGNTDNGAEFSPKTHQLVLKQQGAADSLAFKHILWKTDCAQNPCSGQKGSFTYSRAGWCPGQDVRPWTATIPIRQAGKQGSISPTTPVTVAYRLQPYLNLKNKGYDDNRHIEPSYAIYGYLIEKSDSLAGFLTYHNVTCESVKLLNGQLQVTVSNTGTEPVTNLTIYSYADGVRTGLDTRQMVLKPNSRQTLVLAQKFSGKQPRAIAVVVNAPHDDNGNDDVATLLNAATVERTN